MMNFKPEVLIYLNQVKSFLSKNDEARLYFMSNTNPEIFYEKLCKISEKNFDDSGEPNLTQIQFEELRLDIMKLKEEKVIKDDTHLIVHTKFGTYSLN